MHIDIGDNVAQCCASSRGNTSCPSRFQKMDSTEPACRSGALTERMATWALHMSRAPHESLCTVVWRLGSPALLTDTVSIKYEYQRKSHTVDTEWGEAACSLMAAIPAIEICA